jgi:hypothetical protein
MRYQDDMDEIFDDLISLTVLQRKAIKERYRFMMAEYRLRCRFYTVMFYLLRMTMTVGSLAVPALLSIQTTTVSASAMYWFTWGLSLAVTTANGVTTLFKLDKRFFMLHATAERLRTETWQYVQLSGRYSGHHGHVKPTHANQFVYYCSQLEKIHMKRVDEEFIKNADMDAAHHPSAGPQSQNPQKSTTLVPSPPDQALSSPPLHQSQQSHQSQRRDSESTVGSNDTAIQMAEAHQKEGTGTHTLSVSRSRGSVVPATGEVGLAILPAASEV